MTPNPAGPRGTARTSHLSAVPTTVQVADADAPAGGTIEDTVDAATAAESAEDLDEAAPTAGAAGAGEPTPARGAVSRLLRRLAGLALTVVLVGVMLGLATLFWLVRQEGWLVQTVATGSMAPTVPSGSVIVSRPVDPAAVEVGDIIVFRSPTGATVSGGADGAFEATEEMLITHRVVAVERSRGVLTFRTQGDGNAEEDPWDLSADLVRARYVAHVPHLGGLLATPGLRRWLFLAVAAVGVGVIVLEVRSMQRELRARRVTDVPDDEVADESPGT